MLAVIKWTITCHLCNLEYKFKTRMLMRSLLNEPIYNISMILQGVDKCNISDTWVLITFIKINICRELNVLVYYMKV